MKTKKIELSEGYYMTVQTHKTKHYVNGKHSVNVFNEGLDLPECGTNFSIDATETEMKAWALNQVQMMTAPTYNELIDALRSCHAWIVLNTTEMPVCGVKANELLLKVTL